MKTVFGAKRICFKKRQYRNYNIPNHYDMFESNSENPALFTDNIRGGKTLEFNREYDLE